jgi:segregation and condensation protein A
MASTPAALTSPLQVELDLFRGPLHTLLDLIERRELPVTRVSLVEVADQYLALVRGSATLDLDLTAEFLHVAARLLLLKSLALLPHVAAEEPREDGADEDDLEARLLAYRRFRDAARALAARQDAGIRMFPRVVSGQAPVALPTRFAVEPARLRRAALRALERRKSQERARAAAPSPLIPFTEVLHLVAERLRLRRQARFRDLVSEAGDVIVAITMFLAVLELVRQRRLSLHQHETFGPIELRVEGGPGDAQAP